MNQPSRLRPFETTLMTLTGLIVIANFVCVRIFQESWVVFGRFMCGWMIFIPVVIGGRILGFGIRPRVLLLVLVVSAIAFYVNLSWVHAIAASV